MLWVYRSLLRLGQNAALYPNGNRCQVVFFKGIKFIQRSGESLMRSGH